MEQQKLIVVIDGEIDTAQLEDVFFTTLFERILELRHNEFVPTKKA